MSRIVQTGDTLTVHRMLEDFQRDRYAAHGRHFEELSLRGGTSCGGGRKAATAAARSFDSLSVGGFSLGKAPRSFHH